MSGPPSQDRPREDAPRVERYADLADRLGAPEHHGVQVVAVDGGSASGKSTFASRLAAALGSAPLVHTDDVAWHHSFFDWWPLLADEVLRPLRAGRRVSLRPAAWTERGRPGSIDATPAPVVVVEGVGAGRRELATLIDVVVWVDADRRVARERGLARPGEDPTFWDTWMAAEEAHLAADRPWTRADLVVDATSDVPHDPDQEYVRRRSATWPAGLPLGSRLV